jgi:hypothetical protein
MNRLELHYANNISNLVGYFTKNWFQSPKTENAIIKVAGIHFYQIKDIYHHLSTGVSLQFKVENDNQFDKNAVAVYYKNFKLGYLPKHVSYYYKKMLEANYLVIPTVHTSIRDKYLPTEQLYIEIKLN